ncbi:MAG: endonuclease [Nanoarchaeota archaeon]
MINLYNNLLKEYGKQNWWPYATKNKQLEMCLGAILTQNTSWNNVEKALSNLNRKDLINKDKLAKISVKKLAFLIKSSGYHNQKARKIKEFIKFLNSGKEITRENLLDIWGIGPDTADSILLYAYNKPYFVIDAYTKRIFSRLGYCKEDIKYEELQNLITNKIPKDVDLYKEFHALLVKHGKNLFKDGQRVLNK